MKKKSRMKDYIVTVAYSHESFGGYDHNDGEEDFEVKAMNDDVAKRKALALARKDCGGYEVRTIYTRTKQDEEDEKNEV